MLKMQASNGKRTAMLLLVCMLSYSVAFPQIGKLDRTFQPGTGFDGTVRTTCIQPDGKIIAAGQFETFNGGAPGGYKDRIVRINTDGSRDRSFDPTRKFEQEILIVALQPNGKILVGSFPNSLNGTSRRYLARLNANGTLDTDFKPFGTGINGNVHAIAIQPDGKIIVAGDFTAYNGTPIGRIARLNADGTLDGSFAPPEQDLTVPSVHFAFNLMEKSL